MKKVLIVFIGVVVVLGIVYGLAQPPRMSQTELERFEVTNQIFKVRVIALADESGDFVGGGNYRFQSAKANASNWRDIMTVRHDDPVKIPREQVRFIGDKIGYAYMLYNYAITVNGGDSWFVWYAPKDLDGWRETRSNIVDVQISQEGIGTMRLRSSTDQVAPELHTLDFGRHWNPK